MQTEPFGRTGLVSWRPLAVLAAIAALTLFWFFGVYVLTVAIPVGIGFLIARFAVPRRSRLFLPSFGALVGYVLLLLISVAALMGLHAGSRLISLATLAQALLYVALMMWLVLRPGWAPVALLSVLQAGELVNRGVKLAALWDSTIMARSLIVYMVLHLLTIALLVQEFLLWRRAKASSAANATSAASAQGGAGQDQAARG